MKNLEPLTEAEAAIELQRLAKKIARMLSDAEITPEARAQADRLLEGV
jgi:DNA repair ATPase RecN